LRLRFLTNRPLQFRFLVIILISMFVPLVLAGGCLYYLIFTLLAEQLGIPESIAYNLFPVIKKINLILAAAIPPVAVFLLLWGVFLSHKFIGPLVRLEKEIDKIASSGDRHKRIRVRRTDVIKPIVDAINRLMDAIGGK
jgi:methyl-accepting chemotaxis protein